MSSFAPNCEGCLDVVAPQQGAIDAMLFFQYIARLNIFMK
jgi:hypothetical protein